jgi:hypothetical protein
MVCHGVSLLRKHPSAVGAQLILVQVILTLIELSAVLLEALAARSGCAWRAVLRLVWGEVGGCICDRMHLDNTEVYWVVVGTAMVVSGFVEKVRLLSVRLAPLMLVREQQLEQGKVLQEGVEVVERAWEQV